MHPARMPRAVPVCLFFEKILISTPWRFLSSKEVESDDGATWVEKPIPNNKQPLTDREFGGLGHVQVRPRVGARGRQTPARCGG